MTAGAYKEHSQNEAFLCEARKEILRFSLISHLSWSIWSLVQYHNSQIEFDYLHYAQLRMKGYKLFQEQLKALE